MKKNLYQKNEKISAKIQIQADTLKDSVNNIGYNNDYISDSNIRNTATRFECNFEGCTKSFRNVNRLKIHTNNHVINNL